MPLEQSMGLRARKKDQVSDRLTRSAFRRFLKDGYEATTVEAIAADADVSRRTLFRYFRSKDDIVFAWTRARGEELHQALAARPPDEPVLDAVRAALQRIVEYQESDSTLTLAILKLVGQTPGLRGQQRERQALWQQTLAAGIGRRLGKTASDVEPQLIAGVAMAAYDTALAAWARGRGRRRLGALVDEAFALLAQLTKGAWGAGRRSSSASPG